VQVRLSLWFLGILELFINSREASFTFSTELYVRRSECDDDLVIDFIITFVGIVDD